MYGSKACFSTLGISLITNCIHFLFICFCKFVRFLLVNEPESVAREELETVCNASFAHFTILYPYNYIPQTGLGCPFYREQSRAAHYFALRSIILVTFSVF